MSKTQWLALGMAVLVCPLSCGSESSGDPGMCEGGQCPAVDAGKVDGAAGSGGTAGDSGSGGAAGAGQDASSSASPFCQDWCSKVVGANCPPVVP